MLPDFVDPSLFNIDFNNALHMAVKPGSKVRNSIPYAITSFLSEEYEQVVWWSCQGATAKTVAFAEQFKAGLLKRIAPADSDGDRGVVNDQFRLYQCTKIGLRKRLCKLTEAELQYNLEEPVVSILFSKIPLPNGSSHVLIISSDEPVQSLETMSDEHWPLPPSRRRLEHTKKRKRSSTMTNPKMHTKRKTVDSSNQSKDSDADLSISQSTHSESGSMVIQPVTNQCARLESALDSVTAAFSQQKTKEKKKRKTHISV